MARKPPTLKTVKKLFALSGNVCAFHDPQCNENMVDEKGNVIGKICHIEAANKKGERFNEKSNDEVRRDFDNLILLCDKHHIETNNVVKYKVDVLQKMKEEHEMKFINNKFKVTDDTIADAIIKYEKSYTQINTNIGGIQVNQQADTIINNIVTDEKQELTIIDGIFNYVLKQLNEGIGKDYKPDVNLNLPDKIKLNFKSTDEQEAVVEYFKYSFTKYDLIRRRFEILDTEYQKDIHSHIFGVYQELKTNSLSNLDILHTLFKVFTPTAKKGNSIYMNLAKAFVLFFFEDCTIFEKTKAEKIQQTKLDL
ncbi:MAG: hypothetical protein A2W98_05380 [Bacteroidetes bacterium GWF2_33_38]|nr:MAG: hypothetical protein A2W98_05380 [Bacteroidetes bacterium GWF2_33_38]OFY73998.1 MAG: hypothetical protein A2265_09410 [Bacteroidetes bacterium RIFOXYA12_FULL_33_9]OFY92332.1 MAG: hypothetical protein A2236_01805 [Bacteroidetes bacterium RIFOXYA2_FULL_33_7]